MHLQPSQDRYPWYQKSLIHFCSSMLGECSGQISWKSSNSTYPINSVKEMVFSQKKLLRVIAIWRVVNTSHPYLDVCQQNMLPANEIMAPLAFTASEMILVGTPRPNSVTVTFPLVELQHAFIEQSSPLVRNGENQEKYTGQEYGYEYAWSLAAVSQSFLQVSLRNSALVFFLGTGFDFFTVQGLFSSFLACFMTSIRSDR